MNLPQKEIEQTQSLKTQALRACVSSALTVAALVGLSYALVSLAPRDVAAADPNAQAAAQDANASNAAPTLEETSNANEQSEETDLSVDWLPDLRVLVGTPDSTIELDAVARELCEKNYFDLETGSIKPEDLQWSLKQNTKSSVADVEVVGTKARVHWNSEPGKTTVVLRAAVEGAQSVLVKFDAEAWKANGWKILATVLGGLGLFLLGMKNLTVGLTGMAGSRLRRMISFFTNNRFAAVGVGFAATVLVQSSSATTVMTMGFVDSGLMELTQALNVIIGTNIGSTTTGWLLTFPIGALGLPMLGAAAFVLLFFKNEKTLHLATFTLGFGMIFFGLDVLKSGMEPLRELPQFDAFIRSIQATTLLNAGKGILVGTLATMLVQSSAVTLAIVMTMASLGTIDLTSGIAIVLGSNIGTTITAMLASLGAGPNARRAAYYHVVFNVVGVSWAWILFYPIVHSTNVVGDMLHMADATKLALMHTSFNVVNSAIFLPFTPMFVNLFKKYVKDGDSPKKSVTGLTVSNKEEPVFQISHSRNVVQTMFRDCLTLEANLDVLHEDDYSDEEIIQDSFRLENKLDSVQDETIDFISRLTAKTISKDVADSAREQIRLAQELETISDYLVGTLKSRLKLKNAGLTIPDTVELSLSEFRKNVETSLDHLRSSFEQHQHKDLVEPMQDTRNLNVEKIKETREAFVQEMFQKQYDPNVIVAVDYQLNAWRRMFEHLLNIAEAMEKPGQTGKQPGNKLERKVNLTNAASA